jgi:2,4-dienoyl-CoA reductase-like NADH-dependent reductase (Old Yellow Enzyme family)
LRQTKPDVPFQERTKMSSDPLLQPYKIKNLTLRNRIMTTSHEPAYPVDGMPKDLYRAYHVERAKAGVALTMTAGSAAVSRDSPPVFNNVLAYKDEVVGWLKDLTDECHEHGAAVMIQLTHLGRRTRWDKADWLPVVSPSHRREASHRSFPKKLEEWDIQRIIKDYVDAAERMKAAGMDGLELQAYGHLMDQFWSPLTNDLQGEYGGSLDNRLRFTFDILRGIRKQCGEDFLLGVRYTGDEGPTRRIRCRRRPRHFAQAQGQRFGGLPQRRQRPHRHRCRPHRCDPDPGHAQLASSGLRR